MRFRPTPAKSSKQRISCFSNSALAPIPDRNSIAGLQYAPPLRTTSLLAWYVCTRPSAVFLTTTPVARKPSESEPDPASTRTLSTVAPVTTVTFLRWYPFVTKSALVVRRPLYTVRGACPHPCGVSPVENMSGTKGRPAETKESMMYCEMGARSCGSVCKGPE